MKKSLRITLIVLLCAVVVFSITQLVRTQLDYQEGTDIYNEAAQSFISERPASASPEVAETEVDEAEAEVDEAEVETAASGGASGGGHSALIKSVDDVVVDFQALKQINSEVIGWLVIENTVINYPLMRAGDNSKYLNTTYNGLSNKQGSIFLDCYCKSDLTGPNSIIYGHNMRNNSMFGSLKQFAKQSYFENHRYIYIITETGRLKYAVFAAYTADVTSNTFKRSFTSEEDSLDFINSALELTQINTSLEAGVGDRFVTLSTCTANSSDTKRFVVQSILVEDSRI